MKNIIVIADTKGGKYSALQRALAIQKQTQAKITLLGFDYVSIKDPKDLELAKLSRKKLEKAVLGKREKEIQKALKDMKAPSKQIKLKMIWSKDIAPAVINYCKEHPADLLLKSGSGSGNWLHTSTDWKLLRDCPIPVLISANKSWKKKRKLLVAVDFATTSKSKQKLNHKLVQQAKTLADVMGDEIHLAFALTVPQVLADMDLIDPRKYAAEKQKQLKPTIDKFCRQYDIDPNNIHTKRGIAEKVIPSIANSLKADLVVTGTLGRKSIKGKVMGNTAEGILSKLYTDILAIKP